MAPGPTRSGMAIGTAPKLSGDDSTVSRVPEIKILMDIIRSRIPPATSKLYNESPKIVKISWPVNAKTSNKITPTSVAVL